MRFYVSPESIFPERNIIEIKDKDEIHHIRDVMRLGKGTSVDIFDGKTKEYLGYIKDIDRNSVIIEITKTKAFKHVLPVNITLYQAIPKKNKMDFIVEKAVELGVKKIVPMITERTIPIIRDSTHRKIERWRRITRSASKQCGRLELPLMSDVTVFNHALIESEKSDTVIFAALDKDRVSLKSVLRDLKNLKNIAVFIGPEGDFSPKEISMAKEKGFSVYSLGNLVLRVETAAIYILSCLNYEYTC